MVFGFFINVLHERNMCVRHHRYKQSFHSIHNIDYDSVYPCMNLKNTGISMKAMTIFSKDQVYMIMWLK